MRETQYMGLTSDAEHFLHARQPLLSATKVTSLIFTDGSVVTNAEQVKERKECRNEYAVTHGMWEEIPLYRYKCSDGDYYEYVQAEPWSSGPMIFIALRKGSPNGPVVEESLWDGEEIEHALFGEVIYG